jgi:hypothetical protein
MSKQRHRRRSQGGTTPETTPETGSGVAQFSVSEVAQFSMSLDTRWASSVQLTSWISSYKWISGPITTVRDGHKLPKAAAATRVGCAAWKWFTESSRGSNVDLGNRLCSVRRVCCP